MVAKGQADASAVDSLVLDYDILHKDKFAKQVRVIKVLGPAAIPPIIVSNVLDNDISNQIQSILLSMHKDPQGTIILNNAGVKQFITVDNSHYDSIRKMHKLAIETGFTVIK